MVATGKGFTETSYSMPTSDDGRHPQMLNVLQTYLKMFPNDLYFMLR